MKLELFNELTILIVLALSFSFTRLVTNTKLKMTLGWVMVGVILANILLNMLLVLLDALKSLFRLLQKLMKCLK